jgi:hypothetical protein
MGNFKPVSSLIDEHDMEELSAAFESGSLLTPLIPVGDTLEFELASDDATAGVELNRTHSRDIPISIHFLNRQC